MPTSYHICILMVIIFLVGCAPDDRNHLGDAASLSTADLNENSEGVKNEDNESVERLNMIPPESVISAEVMLVSASGKLITDETIITAENVAEFLPDSQTAQVVSQYFRENSFEVLDSGSIGISLTGTAQQFSDLFDVTIISNDVQGIQVMRVDNEPVQVLPLDALPQEIQEQIVTLVIVSPPAFHSSDSAP